MAEQTREERHAALLREVQGEDRERAEAACAQMIEENMGLVRRAALRFRDRGCEYEDLLQIGTIGMLRAIRSFDLSRGTTFSTFAVPLIVGEIRRHLRDDGTMRVSRTYKQLAAQLGAAGQALSEQHGREATLAEIAQACGVSREEAAAALCATAPIASLSESVYEDDSGALIDRVTDEESANEAKLLDDRIALSCAISHLPPLWRKILLLRYFRNRTQQQTATLLGLSQVKVSREEKKMLGFLREELGG